MGPKPLGSGRSQPFIRFRYPLRVDPIHQPMNSAKVWPNVREKGGTAAEAAQPSFIGLLSMLFLRLGGVISVQTCLM
jgi:hypothetical protein